MLASWFNRAHHLRRQNNEGDAPVEQHIHTRLPDQCNKTPQARTHAVTSTYTHILIQHIFAFASAPVRVAARIKLLRAIKTYLHERGSNAHTPHKTGGPN